jgi:hypothetical protein
VDAARPKGQQKDQSCLVAVTIVIVNNAPPALQLGVVVISTDGRRSAAVFAGPETRQKGPHERKRMCAYGEENSTAARLGARGCGGGRQFLFLRKLLTLQGAITFSTKKLLQGLVATYTADRSS